MIPIPINTSLGTPAKSSPSTLSFFQPQSSQLTFSTLKTSKSQALLLHFGRGEKSFPRCENRSRVVVQNQRKVENPNSELQSVWVGLLVNWSIYWVGQESFLWRQIPHQFLYFWLKLVFFFKQKHGGYSCYIYISPNLNQQTFGVFSISQGLCSYRQPVWYIYFVMRKTFRDSLGVWMSREILQQVSSESHTKIWPKL